jgi:hypothetical protein
LGLVRLAPALFGIGFGRGIAYAGETPAVPGGKFPGRSCDGGLAIPHPAAYNLASLLGPDLQHLQHDGEVAEWFKAHAWKACVGETLPGVRIPPSPPVLVFPTT